MNNHTCLYYDSEKNLLEFIAPYFEQGFRSNELCVWIVPQSISIERGKKLLSNEITDLGTYLEKGQIEILSHLDFYLRSGSFNPDDVMKTWIEKETQALKLGYSGLRVSGDTSWVRDEYWEGLVDYEKMLNDMISKYKINVLCTYPVENFDVGKIFTVGFSHGATVRKRGDKTDILMNRDLTSFGNGK